MTTTILTVAELIQIAPSLAWRDIVHFPATSDLTLDSSVFVIASHGFDEDDSRPQIGNDALFLQTLSVADIQDVLEIARQQNAECSLQPICESLRYYLTHDAFMQIDKELPR